VAGFEPLNLGSGVDCSTTVLPQLGIKTQLVTLYLIFSRIGNLSGNPLQVELVG